MPADDPRPAAAEGGFIFIPAHGVSLEGPQVTCHGLQFVRLDGPTWSKLEALWMRDQELDPWMMRERVFAVMPYSGDARSGNDAAFARALAAYQGVVTAARLLAPGTWMDAGHVAVVARSHHGENVRMVGSGRPRLWTAVFGEPRKVLGRRREWGARVECRPLQWHLPHGPAFTLDGAVARHIEGQIAVLDRLRSLAPNHGWWVAQRAYERGHDLFVPRRLRLTALFGAFEALYGPFRREPDDPGVGAAVATTLERAQWEAASPAAYVEKNLRSARNRLAHGSDLAQPMDFAAVEENLIDLLRVGLAFSSAWIRGAQQPDGPLPPGPARTLLEFQRWLGRPVTEHR